MLKAWALGSKQGIVEINEKAAEEAEEKSVEFRIRFCLVEMGKQTLEDTLDAS